MFSGFSNETGDFLWGLAFNNERPWFEAHRAEYEKYLLTPFRALADDTLAETQRRWPKKALQLHVARIYRDARRLHGRGPYKEHLWFSLKDWDGLLEGPMFWFEIGAKDWSSGMGFYSATPQQMEAFRACMAANPARAERLASALAAQDEYIFEGERYKRPKGDLGELLNPWYNSRRLGFIRTRDFGPELFDPALPQKLADGFDLLMPMYEYFLEACPPE